MKIIEWFKAGAELADHTPNSYTARPYHLGPPPPPITFMITASASSEVATAAKRAAVSLEEFRAAYVAASGD